MENSISNILNNLSSGKCNVETAIKEINSIKPISIEENKTIINYNENKKYARKIKIFVDAVSDEQNSKRVRINLPAISIRFIKRIIKFAAKIGIKYSNKNSMVNENEAIKDGTELIDAKDLDKIFNLFDALTMLPPFEILNVDSPEAKVHIYTR